MTRVRNCLNSCKKWCRNDKLRPKEADGGEPVLLQLFQTLEHAAYEITGHEDQGEFIIVLVISPPDGIVLGVEVLPEPLEGHIVVVVGKGPLPLVHVEGAGG